MSENPRAGYNRLMIRFAAEFVVIVLGVVVALAFDAWWDSRAERRQEQRYYATLAQDLAADTIEYAWAARFIERSIDAAEHVASAARGDIDSYPATRPLVQSVILASWVNLPDWSTGTMDELIATGSIRLLRNQRVKAALLDRYAEAQEFRPRAQGPEHSTYVEYIAGARGLAPLAAYQGLYRTDLDDVVDSDFGVSDAELALAIQRRPALLPVLEQVIVEWWSLWNLFHYEWDQARDLLSLLETEVGTTGHRTKPRPNKPLKLSDRISAGCNRYALAPGRVAPAA